LDGLSAQQVFAEVACRGRHPQVPPQAGLVPGLGHLLLDCFRRDPAARPTAEQALRRLQAIWRAQAGPREFDTRAQLQNADVATHIDGTTSGDNFRALSKYGTDLTANAAQLDPVIGTLPAPG
jgi:hypothetical protein